MKTVERVASELMAPLLNLVKYTNIVTRVSFKATCGIILPVESDAIQQKIIICQKRNSN